MTEDTFHWLDVDRIGEELSEAHPEIDPMSVSFPDLRRLVTALEGFEEQSGHPSNERILEAVQAAWLAEYDALPLDDEDEDRDRGRR